MNCQEFRDLLVIGICGELTTEQKQELDRHKGVCSTCAAALARAQFYLCKPVKDKDLPPFLKERAWHMIIRRGRQIKNKHLIGFLWDRPIWILPFMALVLILGWAIGRWGFRPSEDYQNIPYSSDAQKVVYLADYFDGLQILLTDTLNRNVGVDSPELLSLRTKATRTLIDQTHFWKHHFAQSFDPEFYSYLDNVEFILIAISNLKPGDQESVDQINRMIQEKLMPPDLNNPEKPSGIF